jgi:NCAIR mutase (PurE)-related protein
MDAIRDLLQQLVTGSKTIDQVQEALKGNYIDHINNMAQLDIFRHARTGIPEVIFAESKSSEMVVEIAQRFLEKNQFAIISRCKQEHILAIQQKYGSDSKIKLDINSHGRTIYIRTDSYKEPVLQGYVGIITAGTSDIPVAEEARMVLQAMGIKVTTTYDVGIAGMHRVFPPLESMIKNKVNVIIVIAGMEGTLPGVISALVDVPVIGVPTSTGYGLGAHGVGALTTMLQSCSPGLSVVNIDNGFGAATMAALIVKQIYKY